MSIWLHWLLHCKLGKQGRGKILSDKMLVTYLGVSHIVSTVVFSNHWFGDVILFAFPLFALAWMASKKKHSSISSLLPGDLMTLCLFSLPTFEFYEAHATIPWEEKPIMAHCKEFQTFDLFFSATTTSTTKKKKRFNTFPDYFCTKFF